MAEKIPKKKFEFSFFIFCIFGLFVLLQDVIVANIGGQESTIGGLVKKIDEALILGSILVLMMGKLAKGRMFTRTPIDLPVLGLISVGIASSFSGKVPLFISAAQLFLLVKGFIIFYFFANISGDFHRLNKFGRFFAIVGIFVLILGLIDLAAPKSFRSIIGNTYFESRAGIPSVQSIFIHPGVFGWFMTFLALYSFSFFFIYRKPKYLFFAFLLATGAFFSMRRKPLIGLMISLIAGLKGIQSTRKIAYGFLVVFITLGILIIFWPKLQFLYDDMMERYIKRPDPFQVARMALYDKSLEIAGDYFPLGAGLGRYGSWMSRVHYSPLYDQYGLSEVYGLSREMPSFINDTFWPMILGETGFLGLLCMCWAIGTLIVMCYRIVHKTQTKYEKAFSLGTLMVLIEGIIESLATPFFVKPPGAYFVFGAVGMTSAMGRNLRIFKKNSNG